MRRIVMTSALALCLVALAMPRLRAQSAQQVEPPAGFPAVGAIPIVTLTSPGAEPRKALRFVIANGHREHMTMDTTLAMTAAMGDTSMPEMKMPPLRAGADLEVTAVSTTGDMTISTTFTDFSWIAAPDTNPSMLTQLTSMFADLKGLSATAVMSSRAVTRDVKLDTSKISNPQILRTMSSIQDMVQHLSMPLPEEPVGVGATWEVRLGLKANAVQSFVKYSVEVTAMDDRSCTLKFALEQTAPHQSISDPSLGGATASIDAMNGTGAGVTKIRFDSLAPTSDVNLNTKTTMSIDMGGNAQQLNMAMSMKMTVTPAVVK